jgi:CHAD domain-containing protein
MPARDGVHPRKSFRQNARSVLPVMLRRFFELQRPVLHHPKRIEELHTLRRSGKPLRYAMEVFRPAFGREFRECLGEIELVIETMGSIHDLDVLSILLREFTAELVAANQNAVSKEDRFPLAAIRAIHREQIQLRDDLFRKLCVRLDRWQREDFCGRILRSAGVKSQAAPKIMRRLAGLVNLKTYNILGTI